MAIGESRTSLGAALPLYFVEVVSRTNLSRSFLNFASPSWPPNDSLNPKAAMTTSGFSSWRVWPWSSNPFGAGRAGSARRPTSRGCGRRVPFGEPAVEQGLEVAEILHPLGQGVADDDDPVALVEAQCGRSSAARRRSRRPVTASAARANAEQRARGLLIVRVSTLAGVCGAGTTGSFHSGKGRGPTGARVPVSGRGRLREAEDERRMADGQKKSALLRLS